ncbi:MAG: hypothetical protein LIO96_02175, partial [Lachnospiraceae bacterium]|nr:hypothetical protein [Lachnospiraceae bacterium]
MSKYSEKSLQNPELLVIDNHFQTKKIEFARPEKRDKLSVMHKTFVPDLSCGKCLFSSFSVDNVNNFVNKSEKWLIFANPD